MQWVPGPDPCSGFIESLVRAPFIDVHVHSVLAVIAYTCTQQYSCCNQPSGKLKRQVPAQEKLCYRHNTVDACVACLSNTMASAV